MLEILHTIASWYVGILIFILIVFWLVLWPFGLIEPVVGFFIALFDHHKPIKSPYKLKVTKSSLRFHEASVRAARNRRFTHLDSPPPTDRQLEFIDNLVEERDFNPRLIDIRPTTKYEASRIIDQLKNMPYRKSETD